MYSYSYKLTKRRLLRKTKRQLLRHLIDPYDSSPGNNPADENNEQAHLEAKSFKLTNNKQVSFLSCTVNIEEDDWISDDEYQDDKRPIYIGSSMTLSTALRLINDFYLNNNLDKQTVDSLLRLIKSLLPKKNSLPFTWKSMNK